MSRPRLEQTVRLKRRVLDGVHPLLSIGRRGNQVQILDELANRAAELMAEHEPSERATLSLPIFRECLETNVLGEDDAPELVGVLQEILVSAFRPAIVNGRHHVYAATPKLIRDRLRHMHVHVERHRHLQHPFGFQAQEER